jgi:hypothetical protein
MVRRYIRWQSVSREQRREITHEIDCKHAGRAIHHRFAGVYLGGHQQLGGLNHRRSYSGLFVAVVNAQTGSSAKKYCHRLGLFFSVLGVLQCVAFAAFSSATTSNTRGSIDQVSFGVTTLNDGTKAPTVILIMSVSSLRAPSIAEGYSCSVRTLSGQTFSGQLWQVPATVTLERDEGQPPVILQGIDALYEKTAERPIEAGGLRRGVLIFVFRSAHERFPLGSTVTIGFLDVLKKSYSAEIVVPKNPDSSLKRYPGIHYPSNK